MEVWVLARSAVAGADEEAAAAILRPAEATEVEGAMGVNAEIVNVVQGVVLTLDVENANRAEPTAASSSA